MIGEFWTATLALTAPVLLGAAAVGVVFVSPQLYRWRQVRGWRRERRAMALTYDDGPDTVTTVALLDLLDELGVKATFYLVGFRAEACPEVVRRIHRAGHEVGSHTQSHRNAWRIWPWTEARDASRGHDTIANIIGETPGCYRPPFGKVSLPNFLALFRRHTRVDWWTVAIEDTVDTFREPRLVASELVTRAEPVVLMHCHHTEPHRRAYMLAVTRSLVTDARRRGLELVKMADLEPAPRP